MSGQGIFAGLGSPAAELFGAREVKLAGQETPWQLVSMPENFYERAARDPALAYGNHSTCGGPFMHLRAGESLVRPGDVLEVSMPAAEPLRFNVERLDEDGNIILDDDGGIEITAAGMTIRSRGHVVGRVDALGNMELGRVEVGGAAPAPREVLTWGGGYANGGGSVYENGDVAWGGANDTAHFDAAPVAKDGRWYVTALEIPVEKLQPYPPNGVYVVSGRDFNHSRAVRPGKDGLVKAAFLHQNRLTDVSVTWRSETEGMAYGTFIPATPSNGVKTRRFYETPWTGPAGHLALLCAAMLNQV